MAARVRPRSPCRPARPARLIHPVRPVRLIRPVPLFITPSAYLPRFIMIYPDAGSSSGGTQARKSNAGPVGPRLPGTTAGDVVTGEERSRDLP
jgi:hypothetical protein